MSGDTPIPVGIDESDSLLYDGHNDSTSKPGEIPLAYAEQVYVEPTYDSSYGTWHDPHQSYVDPNEDYKDLVSFIFILLLGFLCIAILFYPFSYYDDDYY
jgi:hypothetical protein